jgi:1-acyl-sn-glycerol-3-phosphate acyltransferase
MSAAAVDAAEPLIEIARGTLRDLRQREDELQAITLDSTLDHDLGLDSLARVELFTRVEHELGVRLPESLFETAETLRDIAAALGKERRVAPNVREPIAQPVRAKTQAATPPPKAATLHRVLEWSVEHQPEFAHITIVAEGADESITHEQLWREAHVIAGGLQQQGVGPGDAVALMLPTSHAYFCSFFGILLAGAAPVPLYPPTRLSQIEEHVRRHAGILRNAGAVVLITTLEMRRLAGVLRMHAPSLRKLTTHDELRSVNATAAPVTLTADSIALLQYTSGSTGQPKGVVLSHRNILANISASGAALHVRSGEPFVSWLPLYHDMGLIGAWLGSLYFGLPLVIMSPLAFLTRPVRWLEAIHRHRGVVSAAPNFAYELCVKRVTDEELAGLDLTTWRIAMNGAEAVRPETLARFGERFARCGFRSTAMTPVYGLAECAVGLTMPPMDRGPLIDVIDRESFVQHGVASPASPNTVNPLRFPSCGLPIAEHQVRIVDDAGRELGERREGRLEFRGPSTTRGYLNNPEATAKLIRGSWLDSGDRAYRAQGEIFVTGRVKDIIIRAGRHIYPEELEAGIGAIAGVRKGCVAVFGSVDPASGTERVLVLAETRVEDAAKRDAMRQAIIDTVMKLIGEAPDEVVLAAPHTVLKTSSGKIRRAASRELYESGRHRSASSSSTWMQLLRLSLGAALPASARVLRRMAHLAYGAYFWGMFALLGVLTLLLLLPSSRPRINWSITHRAARLFIRVSGVPFHVHGQEHLQGAARRIIVANHSSYLDGLFLAAVLPDPCRFVAKRELERTPVLGLFLRRINAVFVERFDPRASVEDAHQLANLAARGDSLVFFPEGSFTRAPGLMPFHLGAFSAAVEAGLPVLPIALRGTRTVLRDESSLPHCAPVVVHIGEAIEPTHARDAFSTTVELRDAARRFIREHCGEPDLTDHRGSG